MRANESALALGLGLELGLAGRTNQE